MRTDYHRQFALGLYYHDELALQNEIDTVWQAEALYMSRKSPLTHNSDNTWPWTLADSSEEDYGL